MFSVFINVAVSFIDTGFVKKFFCIFIATPIFISGNMYICMFYFYLYEKGNVCKESKLALEPVTCSGYALVMITTGS